MVLVKRNNLIVSNTMYDIRMKRKNISKIKKRNLAEN